MVCFLGCDRDQSFRLAPVRKVWQDLESDERQSDQMYSNSTAVLFGTRDLTKVLIYSCFSKDKISVFFLPLRLDLESSSRPKMASLANAVVRVLKLATSQPGLLFITCSTGCNLGGVANGGGGILFATDPEDWLLPASLPRDVQPRPMEDTVPNVPDCDC